MENENETFGFRITPKMRADIKAQGEKELRDPSNMVRKMISDYLESKSKK